MSEKDTEQHRGYLTSDSTIAAIENSFKSGEDLKQKKMSVVNGGRCQGESKYCQIKIREDQYMLSEKDFSKHYAFKVSHAGARNMSQPIKSTSCASITNMSSDSQHLSKRWGTTMYAQPQFQRG